MIEAHTPRVRIVQSILEQLCVEITSIPAVNCSIRATRQIALEFLQLHPTLRALRQPRVHVLHERHFRHARLCLGLESCSGAIGVGRADELQVGEVPARLRVREVQVVPAEVLLLLEPGVHLGVVVDELRVSL